MCKSCNAAADLVTAIRAESRGPLGFVIPIDWGPVEHNFETNYVGIHAAANALAVWLHAQCRGSTHCTCQHMIDWEGKSIARQTPREFVSENRESVGEASRGN